LQRGLATPGKLFFIFPRYHFASAYLLLRARSSKILLVIPCLSAGLRKGQPGSNPVARTYKGFVSNGRPVGFASWDSV